MSVSQMKMKITKYFKTHGYLPLFTIEVNHCFVHAAYQTAGKVPIKYFTSRQVKTS